jgi:hypothetical protein
VRWSDFPTEGKVLVDARCVRELTQPRVCYLWGHSTDKLRRDARVAGSLLDKLVDSAELLTTKEEA